MNISEISKSVLVTGAAGGIGTGLVKALNKAGWKVIGTDHPDVQPDEQTQSYCEGWVPANLLDIVNNPEEINSFEASVNSALAFNPLAAIVHNAALQRLGQFENLSQSDWSDTFSINLLAPVFISKVFLPQLKNQSGAIVNIGSIHSHLTKPGFTAYATSKAALAGLTRAMAVELGGGIRVNAIEPAAISTPMLEAGFVDNADMRSQLEKFHPTGSIGDPNDVARAVLFLLNPSNSFINGSVLHLGGGIHSRLHDPS